MKEKNRLNRQTDSWTQTAVYWLPEGKQGEEKVDNDKGGQIWSDGMKLNLGWWTQNETKTETKTIKTMTTLRITHEWWMCRVDPKNNAKFSITALIFEPTEDETKIAAWTSIGWKKRSNKKNNTTTIRTKTFSREFVTKSKADSIVFKIYKLPSKNG